jgi:hypothetical protein
MVGQVDAFSATSQTYMADVDVDDASAALIRFASGAHGVFEVAKVCARVQAVCEAIERAAGGRWVQVNEVLATA